MPRERHNRNTVINRRSVLKASGLAGAGLSTGLAGCLGGGGGGGPIRVGAANPTSGPIASDGTDVIEGIRTAVDEQGELLGREIEIIEEDTAGDPPTARNKFEKLSTQDEVDCIVGPVSSACGAAVIDIIKSNQVLTNYPVAASRSAVGENCSPYIFKTSPTNEQQSIPQAKWTAENIDGNVITLMADYTAGQQITEFFRQYYNEASSGGEIVDELYAPMGTQDFSSYFSRIADSDAEVMVSFFPGAPAVRLVKQAADFGLGEQVRLTGIYIALTNLMGSMGDAINGWVTSLDFAETLERPEFDEFASALVESQDVDVPGVMHARGYTATKSILTAMDQAGSANPDDVSDALEGMEMAAPHGDITYRAGDHQAILDFYIRETRNGENVVLEKHENVVQPDTCEAF